MYRLRVRQVAGRIRLLAEERSRERIKIARDLHDTLLQGIHGLTLRFHYSAQKVSDSAERAALENALESADKILDEGGERVRHLRTWFNLADWRGCLLRERPGHTSRSSGSGGRRSILHRTRSPHKRI